MSLGVNYDAFKPKYTFNHEEYVNLYNIDTAVDCQYVLTSPRSLQACKIIRIKPVELLYKTIEECREELGNNAVEAEVIRLHQELEQDRQDKLQLCRITREILISKEAQNEKKPTRRKRELDALNRTKRTLSELNCISNNIHPKKIHNEIKQTPKTTKSSEDYVEDGMVKTEPEVLHLKGGAASSNDSNLSTGSEKSKVDKKKLSEINSFCMNTTTKTPKSKPSQNKFNHFVRSRNSTPDSVYTSCSSSRYATPMKATPKKQNAPKVPSKAVSECGADGFGCSKENTSESTASRGRPLCSFRRRPKMVSYSCENLSIPDHDRKILSLMAMKKEILREEEEFAVRARRVWEADKQLTSQLTKDQEKHWKHYLDEKRKVENMENQHRWNEKERKYVSQQKRLEREIKGKLDRAERRHREVVFNKMLAIRERSLIESKKKCDAEQNLQCMELEAEASQMQHEQQLMTKISRAESIRLSRTETMRRRVASANRLEEIRHYETIKRREIEEEARIEAQRELCQLRETRSCENYQFRLQERDSMIKERSIRRDLKLEAARAMQDELDRGLEQWRDRVVMIQHQNQSLSEERVNRMMQWKRKFVSSENFERERHHEFLMERVMAEKKVKEQSLKDALERKEMKIKCLKREKDIAIRESRRQARNTANLREDLRRTLSPETFDRKVRRVELEVRASGRSSSEICGFTKSHIYLG